MDLKNTLTVSNPPAVSLDDEAEQKAHNPAGGILSAAQEFMVDADALEEVLQVSRPVLMARQKEHREELNRLISQASGTRDTTLALTLDFGEFHKLISLTAKLQRGSFLFRGHLLVALVSRFDAFVSTVARVLLSEFPDRLGKRTLTYADATQFSSIKELRERFIDEEIDNKLRESHEVQLKFLSSLANVPLAADEPRLFADFIELTERRNCHIHCGGMASSQYLRVCSQHEVKFKRETKEGASLNVTSEYLSHARRVLSEMAFKIAQTIVRKVFTDSQDLADMHVNLLGLEMLKDQRWKEAFMVFAYASNLSDKQAGDESNRRNNAINKAQALLGMGDSKAAIKTVSSIDWTASHPKYILAVHLLKQEFTEAAALMPSAALEEDDYRKWPIFASFRSTEEFRNSFLTLFGHDFDQTTLCAVAEAMAVIEEDGGDIAPSKEETLEAEHSESVPEPV